MLSKIKRIIIKKRTKNPYQEINDMHKLIFIHIPKNAGISIEEALFGKKIGHKSILQFEAHNEKKYDEYFKFTVVRNPFDRLVSAFHFLKKGGINPVDKKWSDKNLMNIDDFESFVYKLKDKKFAKKVLNQQHFRPQYKYLVTSKGTLNIDLIMKFENLSSDFVKLTDMINMKDKTLEHKNKSDRNSWEEYYDENSKELIHKLYQKDFELFYEKRLK
jgi:chondroitin 4-sulfotransferase 11